MSSASLNRAKSARNDEFYTLYEDIEKELSHYDIELFRGKRVYCNCDSPESNFVKYFTDNYDRLGVAGFRNTWLGMGGEGNGDFRSEECRKYLMESDIVVTNVPFSLSREYLKLMKEANKKFIFMGNVTMITYKEFFPEIKANRMWLGCTGLNKNVLFRVPHNEEYRKATAHHFKIENGEWYSKLRNICWLTNLAHDKRNTPLDLVGNEYSPEKYPKYDNYDAIEVSKVSEIPDGYTGVMGVPITFLDKYCPEQFEILGCSYEYGDCGKHIAGTPWGCEINGEAIYKRLFIKAKPTKCTTGRQK